MYAKTLVRFNSINNKLDSVLRFLCSVQHVNWGFFYLMNTNHC